MLSAVNWYRYSSTRPGTHFMVVAEASTLQTAVVAFFAGDTHFSFCRVHSSSIRMCVYATSFVPGIFYLFKKNLNASKPSEHPPQVEECLKV